MFRKTLVSRSPLLVRSKAALAENSSDSWSTELLSGWGVCVSPRAFLCGLCVTLSWRWVLSGPRAFLCGLCVTLLEMGSIRTSRVPVRAMCDSLLEWVLSGPHAFLCGLCMTLSWRRALSGDGPWTRGWGLFVGRADAAALLGRDVIWPGFPQTDEAWRGTFYPAFPSRISPSH